MRVRLGFAATCLVIAVSCASAAAAQDKPQLTFNVGAASDYVFRGISLSKERGQIFAGADATYKEIYGGVWTSNANFAPFGDKGTNQEIDVYGGWRPQVGGANLDLGVVYYGYLNQPGGGIPKADYWEAYAKASVPVGPLTLGAAFYYSPEYSLGAGKAGYYEGNAAYTKDKWSVSGAVGRQEVETGIDYTTWNLGVGYAITPKIGLDVRYWDTDANTPTLDEDDPRVVASIKVTF